MKVRLLTFWILAVTLAGTAALLVSTPMESTQTLLARFFAAGPEWAQVHRVYVDPATQEISHGESPSRSLGTLANYWVKEPDAGRVLFIGNSQMFQVSLAPGENAPQEPEKTYPDLVAENFRGASPRHTLCYRLAAPGMSYPEALWYTRFIMASPQLRPTTIVLQINYQTFWNGGIRDGMLDTLDNPRFLAVAKQIAAGGEPYADDFADAVRRYNARKEQQKAGAKTTSPELRLAGPVLANAFESSVRQALAGVPLWQERVRQRGSFYDLLYSARIYLLHIKPTTARSINGTRMWRSQSALKAVAEACRDNKIRLVLFNAPVNPKVSLYRTANDLDRYRQFLAGLRSEYQLPVYDLENSIPAPLWGTWMNGPDPLHLGRQGHRLMAATMVRLLDSSLQ